MCSLRYILFVIGFALLAAGCQRGQIDESLLIDAPTPHEVEAIYQPMLVGDYDGYVNGIHSMQDKSEDYRAQIVNCVRMQAQNTENTHRGTARVEVRRVEQSKTNRLYADAYILVTYEDGEQEQICLPLVYDRKRWWIK